MTLDPAAWLDRPGVKRLLNALGGDGGEARLVGGAVRDLLLGEIPGDLDLATGHSPHEVVRRLEAAGIKAIPTGIDHGTITAVASGTLVEVTTLRADLATDGRRATVAFTDDWRGDAARRDFTINALYADPFSGEIFDYFGGLDDLRDRRVRFIGEPLQRIAEDHLRILRYFRFHARYAVGDPDPVALAACAARANDLMALSRERIADELLKLLGLPDPAATIALMIAHGLFAPVLPEIVSAEPLAALIAAERTANIAPAALRRLAALLPRDPAIADKVAARLKLSNKARKRLALAAEPSLGPSIHSLAYRSGTEAAVDRLLIAGCPDDAAAAAAWPVPRLPVSGGQLIGRGVTQGPDVARALKRIEQAWEDADFPGGGAVERLVDEIVPR